MSELSLERVPGIPPEISQTDLESLASLYGRVFAGEPWREYTRCSLSSVFFGTETQPGEFCPEEDCEATLELAYPLAQTAEYITGELARPDAALLLLRDQARNDELVGFTWGFAYQNPEEFAMSKYKTLEMQVAVSGLMSRLALGANGLWYLSESGIDNDPRYRGRGMSREFHTRRLEIARALGLDAVQRTTAYGNMYRTSRRTMTQIMGTETKPDEEGQLRATGLMVNGVADTELEGRVLFGKTIQQ